MREFDHIFKTLFLRKFSRLINNEKIENFKLKKYQNHDGSVFALTFRKCIFLPQHSEEPQNKSDIEG